MVNQDQQYKDGFDVLLKTQTEFVLPAGLEEKIMHRIEMEAASSKFNFRISPIVIVGFLSSFFICISILANHFDVLVKYVSDIQLTLVLTIVIYSLYELNKSLPTYIQHFLNKRKHTRIA